MSRGIVEARRRAGLESARSDFAGDERKVTPVAGGRDHQRQAPQHLLDAFPPKIEINMTIRTFSRIKECPDAHAY